MDRSRLMKFVPAVLAMNLAACQAPGPTTGTVPPSATPSTSAEASPTAAPVSSPTPSAIATSPSPGQAIISGKIYDENGLLLRQSAVEVTSPDQPDFRQTVAVSGGAYVVTVPTGLTIVLKATQASHTPRTRTLKTTSNGSELTPFTVDFGGEQGGAPYALSKALEIIDTTPANQATSISTSPLTVTFRFSDALDRVNQARFEELVQVRFQLSGTVKLLEYGTLYDNESATMTWSADGREGTFQFGAPIVTAGSGNTSITVGLKPDIPADKLPVTANGERLGRDLAPTTADAAGVTQYQKWAPFFREPNPTAFPPERPNAAVLWGLTHRTDVTFTLASDEKKPRVVKVTGIKGVNGGQDRIDVEFDKPMRGFPTELIDSSVLKASNFRYVLGKSSSAEEITKFNQANPLQGGAVTSEALTFSTSNTHIVQIPLPNGTLTGYSQLKLSVDPSVKDIAGNTVQTSAQDPTTALADHVVIGGLN